MKSSTDAGLASELRPSLLRLARLMRAQRANTSVSLTQMSTLSTLYRSGPTSAGELAALEYVQPPTMTRVIANLEQRGLVQRAAHPIDRRQTIVALTPAGRRLLDAERRSRDAWLEGRLATLSGAEKELLRQAVPILERLATNS